jgi:hypothetical protein
VRVKPGERLETKGANGRGTEKCSARAQLLTVSWRGERQLPGERTQSAATGFSELCQKRAFRHFIII